jgi:hypothetical protein
VKKRSVERNRSYVFISYQSFNFMMEAADRGPAFIWREFENLLLTHTIHEAAALGLSGRDLSVAR